MAYDKQSQGYRIGKSVMSEGKSQPLPHAEPDADDLTPTAGIHSIHVTPAANGFTITHTPKQAAKKGNMDAPGGGDYGKEQTHVFSDAAKAHHHIGRLLGAIGKGTSGQ